MKIRFVLRIIAACAVVGAVAAARSESTPAVPANIQGGLAKGNDARANAGDRGNRQLSAILGAAGPKGKRQLIGDADLKGFVNLTRVKQTGDHYEVELGEGTKAVLTLDPDLQRAAEKILSRAKAPAAAAVVMTVDGQILAMVGQSNGDDAPELATSVWAPAASIFKLVTAAALVEAGVRPESKICYHGGYRDVTESNLKDHPKLDSACNDLTYAIAESQNALIAKMAHRYLTPRALQRMADALGLNDAPRLALDVESNRADIPKDRLDFARVAAGFWQTELSPLGGALLTNIVATGGLAVAPRLVARVEAEGETIPVVSPEPRRVLSKQIARDLTVMMNATIDTGTAYRGFHDPRGQKFLPGMQVAGKTGTLTRPAGSYLQYSWFVGFAPSDKPQVIVSVLLGNPEAWHLKAHTAARMLLEEYF